MGPVAGLDVTVQPWVGWLASLRPPWSLSARRGSAANGEITLVDMVATIGKVLGEVADPCKLVFENFGSRRPDTPQGHPGFQYDLSEGQRRSVNRRTDPAAQPHVDLT